MELSAMLVIAQRDFTKLLRDIPRLLGGLLAPVLLIGVLGGTIQLTRGESTAFAYLPFIFTGVIAQTMFSSAAAGIISLIEDRENDFTQELFVSPVSRYTIVFGKLLGETLVAFPQGLATLIFGLIIGIQMTLLQGLSLVALMLIAALFGSAFGLLVMANIKNPRTVGTVRGFIVFPQFFLAGVFAPLGVYPPVIDIISRLTPMRYPVDLTRGIFYAGLPEYEHVVASSPLSNLFVMGVVFVVFLVIGTWLFVRSERNR